MSNPYVNNDMFCPAGEGRSLHDNLKIFFREALCYKTPLTTIINFTDLANYIHMLPASDELKHKQFIEDIWATKAIDLWPSEMCT